MDLRTYLAILYRNKWIIIITVIVTVAAAAAFTYLTKPIYLAKTTLRIAASSGGVASYSDYMYADRLMNTYTKIATSGPVLEELSEKINMPVPPQVQVKIIPSTELIQVSVESSDPAIAQNAANSLAEILIAQSKELYTGGGKSLQEILMEQLDQAEVELNQARTQYATLTAQIPKDQIRIDEAAGLVELKEKTYTSYLDQYEQARLRDVMRSNLITVIEPAKLPHEPFKPRKTLNALLGVLMGFAGGVGLVFLFENMDTRIYSSKQIETIVDLKPIGKIPTVKQGSWLGLNKQRMMVTDHHFIDAFERIVTKLILQKSSNGNGKSLKVLLITSSVPGEGKSTVTANLGKVLARMEKKVVIVDCDLHMPRQHKLNGLNNRIGISSVLNKEIELDGALQKGRLSNLDVLTSGPLPLNPSELLASSQMKTLVEKLCNQYDVVLLDAPAVLAVSDAVTMIPLVDGVALVARRTLVREEQILEACRQMTDLHAPMVGVIINEAEPNGTFNYYQYRESSSR